MISNGQTMSIEAVEKNKSAYRFSGEIGVRSRDGLNLDNIPTDLISLSIQVTDGRNSDEATVRISVKDVNDRKPQFEQTEYVSSVPENAAIGTIIHHVKATDADFGPNAEISYRQATYVF